MGTNMPAEATGPLQSLWWLVAVRKQIALYREGHCFRPAEFAVRSTHYRPPFISSLARRKRRFEDEAVGVGTIGVNGRISRPILLDRSTRQSYVRIRGEIERRFPCKSNEPYDACNPGNVRCANMEMSGRRRGQGARLWWAAECQRKSRLSRDRNRVGVWSHSFAHWPHHIEPIGQLGLSEELTSNRSPTLKEEESSPLSFQLSITALPESVSISLCPR
jgi:hypothetical protein